MVRYQKEGSIVALSLAWLVLCGQGLVFSPRVGHGAKHGMEGLGTLKGIGCGWQGDPASLAEI